MKDQAVNLGQMQDQIFRESVLRTRGMTEAERFNPNSAIGDSPWPNDRGEWVFPLLGAVSFLIQPQRIEKPRDSKHHDD